MNCGEAYYPNKTAWPQPGYYIPPPNYCPTCGKPWFGGYYWPSQPQIWCKTDTTACQKS